MLLLATLASCVRGVVPSRQQDCAEATRRLSDRTTSAPPSWAYSVMGGCLDGALQLASLWATPPDDPTQLLYLTLGSRGVADRRLLDAVLALATDTSAPSRHRRAALDVTVAYYRPRWFVRPQAWDSTSALPASGSNSHESSVSAEMPLQPSDLERIAALWRALAGSDPDPLIQRMAKELLTFHAQRARGTMSQVLGSSSPSNHTE